MTWRCCSGLQLSNLAQKEDTPRGSSILLVMRRRNSGLVSKLGIATNVATPGRDWLTRAKVSKQAAKTSSVRTPQLSANMLLKLASRLSATKSGCWRAACDTNGLRPTTWGIVGSSSTTSLWRLGGMRSSRLVTRSDLGSTTSTPRPARISARIRRSIAVDLPTPVGPSNTVWSRLSAGEMPKEVCVCPGALLTPNTRPARWDCVLLSQCGGGMTRGEIGPSTGKSLSPIGQPVKRAISLAASRLVV